MELIDYTGMLNSHENYLNVLKPLEERTSYIEVVLIDSKPTNDLVEKFKKDIVATKIVSEWWGTKTVAKNKLIRIKSSAELFNYLRTLETFCKYFVSNRGDRTLVTDFWIDDIAFYNKNDEMLLCTTTHEGYITVNKEIISRKYN